MLGLAGCSDDGAELRQESGRTPAFDYLPSEQTVVFSSDDTTRTTIDTEKDENGRYPVRWSAGDKVGVFCSEIPDASNYCLSIPDSFAGEIRFTGVMSDLHYNDNAAGDHVFYFYYPWQRIDGATCDQTSVTRTLASTQSGVLANEAFTMASSVAEKEGDEWIPIDFELKNPFAYLFFSIATGDADALENLQVASITLEVVRASENAAGEIDLSTVASDNLTTLCGEFKADLTTQTVAFNSGKTSNRVYLAPAGSVSLVDREAGYDYSKGLMMVVNPVSFGTTTGRYFHISLVFSDGTVGETYKRFNNIGMNTVNRFGILWENLQKPTDNVFHVQPWEDVDLSIEFN